MQSPVRSQSFFAAESQAWDWGSSLSKDTVLELKSFRGGKITGCECHSGYQRKQWCFSDGVLR